jgi:hypothetical protein
MERKDAYAERRLVKGLQNFLAEWGIDKELKGKGEFSVVLEGFSWRYPQTISRLLRDNGIENASRFLNSVAEMYDSIRRIRDKRVPQNVSNNIYTRASEKSLRIADAILDIIPSTKGFKPQISDTVANDEVVKRVIIKAHWWWSVHERGVSCVSDGSRTLFVEHAKRIECGDEQLGVSLYKVSAVSFKKKAMRVKGYVFKSELGGGDVISAFGLTPDKARRLLNRRVTAAVMSKLLN